MYTHCPQAIVELLSEVSEAIKLEIFFWQSMWIVVAWRLYSIKDLMTTYKCWIYAEVFEQKFRSCRRMDAGNNGWEQMGNKTKCPSLSWQSSSSGGGRSVLSPNSRDGRYPWTRSGPLTGRYLAVTSVSMKQLKAKRKKGKKLNIANYWLRHRCGLENILWEIWCHVQVSLVL